MGDRLGTPGAVGFLACIPVRIRKNMLELAAWRTKKSVRMHAIALACMPAYREYITIRQLYDRLNFGVTFFSK